MKLEDINTTTFAQLDPEIQKQLVESTSSQETFVMLVIFMLILLMFSSSLVL